MVGICIMKFVWMMMTLDIIVVLLVVQAHNSLAVSDLRQHEDFNLPKVPKFPHIPVPPKVLIIGLCVYECHAICQAGKPSLVYRACILALVPKTCRPSRLDVVDDCALACMAATTTSADDNVGGYIETCYKNCGKNH